MFGWRCISKEISIEGEIVTEKISIENRLNRYLIQTITITLKIAIKIETKIGVGD